MLFAAEGSTYWVALSVLAAWRLTALLSYEDGPFRVLVRLRRLLYLLRLGSLVECFHCAGLWMSGIVALLVFRWCAGLPVVVLAVAGGVSLLELAVSGRRESDTGEE